MSAVRRLARSGASTRLISAVAINSPGRVARMPRRCYLRKKWNTNQSWENEETLQGECARKLRDYDVRRMRSCCTANIRPRGVPRLYQVDDCFTQASD